MALAVALMAMRRRVGDDGHDADEAACSKSER
jgi:hypothetical protein